MKQIFCFNLLNLLAISISYTTVAQDNNDSLYSAEKRPSLVTDTTAVSRLRTTFTLAAIYSSGIDYYGQTTDPRLPYLGVNGTLRFKPGIYFSATGFHLFGDSMLVSATSLGVGYQFNINKKLSADLSFTHTFFPESSPFLQASSPNILGAEFNYEHAFTTGVGTDYTFGEQKDIFITLNNSKTFSFKGKSEKAVLGIAPLISIVAGTQRFYETYLIERGRRNTGNGNPPTPPSIPSETVTNEYNRFGMLSYNFRLPLSYNRASYLLEVTYQLSLLGNNAAERAGEINSFLTLSFYYQF